MAFYYDGRMLEDLLEIKKRFNYNVIIETGTGSADSFEIFTTVFEKVYGCELLYENYKNDYIKYQNSENYKIIPGDSVESLKLFMKDIEGSEFFLYLDAHGDASPVLDELQVIMDHKRKPIILIHDFDVNIQGWNFMKFYDKKLQKNVSLCYEYVKEKIDGIYGVDEYIYQPATISYNPNKPGTAYFYPKNL
jgi:hypothetical protein